MVIQTEVDSFILNISLFTTKVHNYSIFQKNIKPRGLSLNVYVSITTLRVTF